MKKYFYISCLLAVFFSMRFAQASIKIPMALTASGQEVGYVIADDTIYGLMLIPYLYQLPSGVHGFHVHQSPSCANEGRAAGGHLDPLMTQKHKGPYQGDGHLGDLAVLIVDAQGQATLPVLAPRLKLSDISGHALMIHDGGDNYSDVPKKNGGGGVMLACGVIPYH